MNKMKCQTVTTILYVISVTANVGIFGHLFSIISTNEMLNHDA